MPKVQSLFRDHPLAQEAQARLAQRLEDVRPENREKVITACLTLQNAASLPDELATIYEQLDKGGLFLSVLLGSQTLHELRSCLLEAELALTSGGSPRVHAFPEPDELSRLMLHAGFALPVVDLEQIVLSYPDLPALMRDLRRNGCSNRLQERSRRFAPRQLFEKTQDLYAARFPAPAKGIAVTAELIFLHGWKE